MDMRSAAKALAANTITEATRNSFLRLGDINVVPSVRAFVQAFIQSFPFCAPAVCRLPPDLLHGKIVSQLRIRCLPEFRALSNRILLSVALLLNGTLTASGQANDVARLDAEAQKSQA